MLEPGWCWVERERRRRGEVVPTMSIDVSTGSAHTCSPRPQAQSPVLLNTFQSHGGPVWGIILFDRNLLSTYCGCSVRACAGGRRLQSQVQDLAVYRFRAGRKERAERQEPGRPIPHPLTQQKERLSSVSLLTDAPSHTHTASSRNCRAICGPERALNSQINKL